MLQLSFENPESAPTDSFLSSEFRRMTPEVEAVLVRAHKTAAMIRTRNLLCSSCGPAQFEDRAGLPESCTASGSLLTMPGDGPDKFRAARPLAE
jgi:hypothetical protein